MAVVHREVKRIPMMPAPAMGPAPRHGWGYGMASRMVSALSWAVAGLLALWLAYSLIGDALAVAQQKLDDLRYGYPRSFQLDAPRGDAGPGAVPSHFVALNLGGQISIMVLDPGDPQRVQVLRGPTLYGEGRDLVPPTLRLADVNHDGHADLLLRVNDQDLVYLAAPRSHTYRFLRAMPVAGAPASAAAPGQ